MGLDLALGVIILVAAFRGWFQGFVSQVVRLGSLVVSVYAAARRARLRQALCVALSRVNRAQRDRPPALVGLRRRHQSRPGRRRDVDHQNDPEAGVPGISQSGRNDQFAGFFIGAVKGLLIAVFLAAGIQNYAMDQVKNSYLGR